MAKWNLTKILQSQGFGSRKECTQIIKNRGLEINGQECFDPKANYETDGLQFSLNGKEWTFRDQIYILMNKPLHHPSVLGLLPSPIIARGVQPVGRLDVDTTGILFITDDGQWNHQLTSPKKNVAKVYRAHTKHPVDQSTADQLMKGVLLKDEEETIAAEKVTVIDDHCLEITLFQGKYHQVRRMIAATSNRVETLERVSYGVHTCEGLAPGEWRYLSKEEAYGFSN